MPSLFLRLRVGFLTAILAFLFSASATQADDAPSMGAHAFDIDVPADKVTVAQLHDIVMTASIKRQWIVKVDTAEKVSVYLNHRKIEATVTYVISENQIKAYCDGYALNSQGTRLKPTQPTKWLNNLKKDISTLINLSYLPAKK